MIMKKTNIWEKLPKPFFVQAPMEDVTDSVFRQIISRIKGPDLYFTEFTNVDGIVQGGDGYIKRCLTFTKSETPLIAQIWGTNPEHYKKSAEKIYGMGFNGIDINMGCPVRDIIKNGSCSALIKNHTLAKELYEATVEGAGGLPVSIKTRIGFSKIETHEWIGFLLHLKPAAISVHARTVKELSKVPAHWDEFGKVVELRNKISPGTLIVANGDIEDKEAGQKIFEDYNVDGIMIGRGMLHNPWVFSGKKLQDITLQEKLITLKEHILLFEKTWGKTKNFEIMKKFFKAYILGFDNAQDVRMQLMQYHTAKDTVQAIDSVLKTVKLSTKS